MNRQVGLRFTIIQGSANGALVFSETHSTMTNQNGMVSVEIGGRTPLFNSIGNINWAQGPYYLNFIFIISSTVSNINYND